MTNTEPQRPTTEENDPNPSGGHRVGERYQKDVEKLGQTKADEIHRKSER